MPPVKKSGRGIPQSAKKCAPTAPSGQPLPQAMIVEPEFFFARFLGRNVGVHSFMKPEESTTCGRNYCCYRKLIQYHAELVATCRRHKKPEKMPQKTFI